MKKTKVTLLLAVLLIAMAPILAACGGETADEALSLNTDELSQENQELLGKINELEAQIASLSSADDEVADAPTMENKHYAMGINALLYLDGEDESTAMGEIAFTDSAKIAAKLNAPDDKVLSHWMVNGEKWEGENPVIDAQGNTVIQAVLRDELKVTTINADLQILAKDGTPQGEKMREYVFEDKKIVSVYVTAAIPEGQEVSHWKIDGSPYYFSRVVTYFKVIDLDKTTTYEAVFKQKAPTVTAAPEMVNVSCINATFSGGGYSGASSGQVAKGTTITVTGTYDVGSPQYWLINGSADNGKGKSFSYTVNSNTSFQYTGYN